MQLLRRIAFASLVCRLLKDNVMMQLVYMHCLNSFWDVALNECNTFPTPKLKYASDIDPSTLCKHITGARASAA